MYALPVRMRHFNTIPVGICSPELRQHKLLWKKHGGCKPPMALPGPYTGEVLTLGSGVPEEVNWGVACPGFYTILSIFFIAWAQI